MLIAGSICLGLVAGWAVGGAEVVGAWSLLVGVLAPALVAGLAAGAGAPAPVVAGGVVGVLGHRLARRLLAAQIRRKSGG